MACIWMDGFEIDFADNTAGIWTTITQLNTSTVSYVSTQKRTGSGALRVLSSANTKNGYLSQTLASSYTEVYGGFGLRWDNAQALAEGHGGLGVQLMEVVSSDATPQLSMTLDTATNVLRVYRGRPDSGVLLGSGVTGLTTNVWHYVEFHFVISDTVGVVQLKVNGALDLDLSAQDTNVSASNIKTISIGITEGGGGVSSSKGASADLYFDDFVLNNTTGSVSNSWPNGAGIERLDPNADGSYTQWTSTGGAADSTEVDDVATYGNLPDGNTTKLSHAVVGQRTSVALDATTISGDVLAIMLLSNVMNSAAGADQMAQFVRTSSIDYDQTTFTPSTAYAWQADMMTLNPATGVAWTTAELNNLELGWVVK